MIKRDELSTPTSCLNKATDDERIFVLLARDEAAPVAIRAWVAERIRLGKNHLDDPQIIEALECAAHMDRERFGAQVERIVEDPLTQALRQELETRTDVMLLNEALRICGLDRATASHDQIERVGRALRVLGWRRARRLIGARLEYVFVKTPWAQEARP